MLPSRINHQIATNKLCLPADKPGNSIKTGDGSEWPRLGPSRSVAADRELSCAVIPSSNFNNKFLVTNMRFAQPSYLPIKTANGLLIFAILILMLPNNISDIDSDRLSRLCASSIIERPGGKECMSRELRMSILTIFFLLALPFVQNRLAKILI